MHRALLQRARNGLEGRGRLRSVFIRRTISDAYYALFHAIAAMCADSLVGSTRRNGEAWRRIYRTLDHGPVREELRRPESRAIHPGITKIASDFARLQDARHDADYDPTTEFRRRDEAIAFVNIAEAAIADIEALPADVRLELSAALVAKRRR